MGGVVLVDDDSAITMMGELLLARAGIAPVHVFNDGASALGHMQAALPDLLITDLNMPGMSGADLLAAVRGHAKLSQIPVVVLTADGRADHHDQLLRAGATQVWLKPFSPNTFGMQVRDLIS